MKIFLLILSICLGFFGKSVVGASTLQEQIEAETGKREQMLQPLKEAYGVSRKLVTDGKSSEACELLEKAYEALPEVLRGSSLALEVNRTLSKLQASLSESAAQKNHWPEARRRALASLQHDPKNELALLQLKKSDEVLRRGVSGTESVNPALTTKFFDRLTAVRSGLEEAQAYRETGQLAKAEERYEDVLEADPFNQVATQGIQKIYEERALVAEKARDLSNLERRREVREAWNNIYPKSGTTVGGIEITGAMTASPAYALEKKLQKTVIPQVDFSGADLETIRRALISLSRTYDPEAAKGGVNFVVSTDVANSQPVTLRLRQTSLAEVVRYISQIAGVKARITDIGVTFGPLVEKRPELNSQNFTVSPSFFKESDGKEDAVTDAPRGAGGGMVTAGSDSAGKSEQKKLEDLGVVFPPGAYAVYNQKTSQLKVVNNQEMLDMIGQLISAAEEQTLLIQVGVRLVEINQLDLDSITVNSTLGGSGINLLSPVPTGLLTNSGGATPSASGQRGVNAQLNQIQGVGLLPNNTLQSFLQSGVLAGTNQSSAYSLNTMDLGGTILNGMQFRTLITAVSQKNSANVLANPSIILKRGQKGVIEVSQEFKYVKEYSDPQSSIRTINTSGAGGGSNSVNVSANQSVPGPETVIGSFPSQISDAVPIGVKMGVKPDVTGDNSRVLLELEPSFVDFEGFINYGTQINSAYTQSYFQTAVTIMTNIINQPVFIRRDLTLPAVEVSDGYTLLLGGLLREDIQKIDEKVPIIGDIPIFGRAFQGKTEQAVKKNTLIFVTPRILDVSGQPLNPTAGSPTTASASGTP
jgi:general secretion pathway protein D